MTRAKLYIGGEWVSAAAGKVFESRNPSDGSLIATLQEATSPDLDLAVAAANGVNKFLRQSTVEVRASWCEAIANKIEASAELLADAMAKEQGKPRNREAIWDAWTKSSELEQWHHPVGMSCLTGSTRSDLHLGGIWSYAVEVPGRPEISYFFGKYSEIELNLRFVHSMHYTESSEAFEKMDFGTPSHLISVEFETRGKGAWSKFSQFGEAPAEQVVLMTQGIESYFDSLENFLK